MRGKGLTGQVSRRYPGQGRELTKNPVVRIINAVPKGDRGVAQFG